LITDDIIDGNKTRRGKLCWHQLPDFKSTAINDRMLISLSCNYLLTKYFSVEEYYEQLLHLFFDTKFVISIGKIQDKIDACSMESFETMASNKCYLFVYFPVAAAMIMNGYKDQKLHEDVNDVMRTVMHSHQAFSDYFDCFGGTDIQEGKINWLIIKALNLASEDQKIVLKQSHTKKDHAEAVKEIYRDLKLSTHLIEYGRSKIDEVSKKVQFISDEKIQSFIQNVVISNANKELSNLAGKTLKL